MNGTDSPVEYGDVDAHNRGPDDSLSDGTRCPTRDNEGTAERPFERMRGIEPPFHSRTSPVECYLTWLVDVKRLAPTTIEAYADTLNTFSSWLGDDTPWTDITPELVVAYITRERRHGKPPAAATQRRDRAVLKQFFLYLSNTRQIEHDPMWQVPSPKVRNRSPRPIPDRDWLTLWATPRLGLDDRLWLGLGYFAGLRRVEMATLAVEAIDVDREEIVFSLRKGGSIFPVEYGSMARTVGDALPVLRQSAEDWCDVMATTVSVRDNESLLVSSCRGDLKADTNWFNKRLVTLRRQARTETHFTPHALRHSCATNLLRAGVPEILIADLLSHASVDTTRRYLVTSGQLDRLRRKE